MVIYLLPFVLMYYLCTPRTKGNCVSDSSIAAFENIEFYIHLFIKIVNIGAVGGDRRAGSISGYRFA